MNGKTKDTQKEVKTTESSDSKDSKKDMNGDDTDADADTSKTSKTSKQTKNDAHDAIAKQISSGPISKNGGFIGIELNFSQLDMEVKNPMSGNYKQLIDPVGSYNAGLVGGYQHYFGESKKNGVKVSAHLYGGYSSISASDFSKATFGDVMGDTKMDSYYVPISFGFDVKYLFDIIQAGKHSFGFSVGVGYELSEYLHMNTSTEGIGSSATSGGTTTTTSTMIDSGRKSDFDFLTQGFYPVIGLHYYYGHNQFEVLYRFGGALAQTGYKDVGPAKDAIRFNSNDYVSLNYSYRF